MAPGWRPRAALSLLLGAAAAGAARVTVSNVQPRLDAATGEILELGDGSIAKFGDRFYLYGVKYVCTPSPRTPDGFGCPRHDRRIWGAPCPPSAPECPHAPDPFWCRRAAAQRAPMDPSPLPPPLPTISPQSDPPVTS